MALKRKGEAGSDIIISHDVTKKTNNLFNQNKRKKENKILTTFSIEPSFKRQLEELFDDYGLGWAAGIRFALKEFYKKHEKN